MAEKLNVTTETIAMGCLDPTMPVIMRAANFDSLMRSMPEGWGRLFSTTFETMNSVAPQVSANREVIKTALLLALVAKDLIDAGAVFCVPGNPEERTDYAGT